MTLEGSNFHQMAPNWKGDGMVSIKKSQFFLWIIFLSYFIPLQTCLGLMKKRPKLLRNCDQIPPRVMDKIALQIKYDPLKFLKIVME